VRKGMRSFLRGAVLLNVTGPLPRETQGPFADHPAARRLGAHALLWQEEGDVHGAELVRLFSVLDRLSIERLR